MLGAGEWGAASVCKDSEGWYVKIQKALLTPVPSALRLSSPDLGKDGTKEGRAREGSSSSKLEAGQWGSIPDCDASFLGHLASVSAETETFCSLACICLMEDRWGGGRVVISWERHLSLPRHIPRAPEASH